LISKEKLPDQITILLKNGKTAVMDFRQTINPNPKVEAVNLAVDKHDPKALKLAVDELLEK